MYDLLMIIGFLVVLPFLLRLAQAIVYLSWLILVAIFSGFFMTNKEKVEYKRKKLGY